MAAPGCPAAGDADYGGANGAQVVKVIFFNPDGASDMTLQPMHKSQAPKQSTYSSFRINHGILPESVYKFLLQNNTCSIEYVVRYAWLMLCHFGYSSILISCANVTAQYLINLKQL